MVGVVVEENRERKIELYPNSERCRLWQTALLGSLGVLREPNVFLSQYEFLEKIFLFKMSGAIAMFLGH